MGGENLLVAHPTRRTEAVEVSRRNFFAFFSDDGEVRPNSGCRGGHDKDWGEVVSGRALPLHQGGRTLWRHGYRNRLYL